MKINGIVLDKPKEVLLVLPREPKDLVFKFRAVVDYTEFEKMCPMPTPPKLKRPGGVVELNTNDAVYQAALNNYAEKQTHYQFLKSISATDGLEWSRVKMEDSSTWHHWREEIKEAGFSVGEQNAIWSHFVKANNLSQDSIDEARTRFLASQRAEGDALSSLTGERLNSSSGEPVSVSVLDQRALEDSGKT